MGNIQNGEERQKGDELLKKSYFYFLSYFSERQQWYLLGLVNINSYAIAMGQSQASRFLSKIS